MHTRNSVYMVAALTLLFCCHSVATTTSKNVATVQREIQAVLDRVGIQYRPSKTGFECVHVPSIDLSSVQPAEGTAASMNKTGRAPLTNGIGESLIALYLAVGVIMLTASWFVP
jgi:hypothetical protein